MCLGDEPFEDRVVDPVGQHRPQQRRGRQISQAVDDQLREPAHFVRDASRREHEGDALGHQPARDERERLGRFAVEPLRVVDDAEQRSFGPELRQQAQHRQANE